MQKEHSHTQRRYTKFILLIMKALEEEGFWVDKKNYKMTYYVNDKGQGVFFLKRLLQDLSGFLIICKNDLSIGTITFTDFPFGRKPIFVYRRHNFIQTIKSIIDIHEFEVDINRKKTNRIKQKERASGEPVYHSSSTICRRGFGI